MNLHMHEQKLAQKLHFFYFIFLLQPHSRSCVAKWCKNLHDDGADGWEEHENLFFFSPTSSSRQFFVPPTYHESNNILSSVNRFDNSFDDFFFSPKTTAHIFSATTRREKLCNTFEIQFTQIKGGGGHNRLTIKFGCCVRLRQNHIFLMREDYTGCSLDFQYF